jgi:transposase
MKQSFRRSCSRCRHLQDQLDALQRDLRQLREQLAVATKTSATSSKPPSSDIVKPKLAAADPDTLPRSIGAQPGHPLHTREPFAAEHITASHTHTLAACPGCGCQLERNGTLARVVQQVDVLQAPLSVAQHTCPEYWCGRCQKPYWAPFPVPIQQGGLVGPQLTALIAFLKGACHASFSTIRTFLRDVVGVTLSRGQLSKTINKVSAALEGAYAELLSALPEEAVLNVDETGHPCQGERWWTWCLRAELYTVYHIDACRNAEVLMGLLGRDFQGVLGCDYFSAYRRYMRECGVSLQFCLAHLIRDVKFLTTLPDPAERAYGERLRGALKALFEVIHRRETLSEAVFQIRLQAARDAVLRAGLEDAPATRHAQNLARRFRQHGEAYFRFVTTPGVEPTNNLAEQAIRFVVIDRHITQGTRSAAGRRWSERIWTVIATCSRQGRSVYAFLREAIDNWFTGQAAPSLLPQGTS